MNEEKIKRINELYHLSKERALTEEELKEQGILRSEYLSAIRSSVKGHLENVKIVEKNGEVKDLLSIKEQKQRIREIALSKRKEISKEVRDDDGKYLASELLRITEILKVSRVLLFASKEEEVPTDPTFDALNSKGIQCYYPVTKEDHLEFYRAESPEELKVATFGVREPEENPEKSFEAFLNRIENNSGKQSRFSDRNIPPVLILVPGLTFDADGYRIGYGKGYYDNFLASLPENLVYRTVGVCFKELKKEGLADQISKKVPREKHDRNVNFIIFV